MTERDWIATTDMTPVLRFLRDRTSDRKLRLFAVACCRSIWHLLPNEATRTAVHVAERHADALASDPELLAAGNDFAFAEWEPSSSTDSYLAALATEAVTQLCRESDVFFTARTQRVVPTWPEQAYEAAAGVSNQVGHITPLAQRQEEWNKQIGFIRCIYGNPFRPVTADPSWLTSDVVALAEGIYQDRAFDRMPILADALQDAGCDNEDILAHCRDEGQVHVRGCWVVDLVLGKA